MNEEKEKVSIKEIANAIVKRAIESQDYFNLQTEIEEVLHEKLRPLLNTMVLVRRAQKTYFLYRTDGNLNIAKKHETAMDGLLESLFYEKKPKDGDLWKSAKK